MSILLGIDQSHTGRPPHPSSPPGRKKVQAEARRTVVERKGRRRDHGKRVGRSKADTGPRKLIGMAAKRGYVEEAMSGRVDAYPSHDIRPDGAATLGGAAAGSLR
jgi:hypothetical protein